MNWKHRNCCQGRISFWSWEDFSLVEFSPLPEDISRWLCSQISCEEKLTRCKQSYQAREDRGPPCLASKSTEWPCWISPAEKSFKHHENSPSNKNHSLVCTAREGTNVQEGISGGIHPLWYHYTQNAASATTFLCNSVLTVKILHDAHPPVGQRQWNKFLTLQGSSVGDCKPCARFSGVGGLLTRVHIYLWGCYWSNTTPARCYGFLQKGWLEEAFPVCWQRH